MKSQLKIDFVSDVSCPWCVIGLKSLETALGRLADQVAAHIHFQPFELNPQMPAGGQDIGEHLAEKYGSTPEQSQRNREAIRARGAELGFAFGMANKSRIYNTFDAHRLLHWAETATEAEGKGLQLALKEALFTAYFTHGEDPSSHAVLARVAGEAGLNTTWQANLDFLRAAVAHARRVENVALPLRFDVRQRETRRDPWPDAWALAREGWASRSRPQPPSVA